MEPFVNIDFQALLSVGRVQRTLFLLTYMIDPALQQHIRAETTKVEASHHFTDWLAFGSPIFLGSMLDITVQPEPLHPQRRFATTP